MPLSSTINLDASVHTMTTSFDTLMSPPRRTSHGRVAASSVVVTSPRGDHDSQRACIIRPPAVTGCTGRGRYLIDEFVQFSVGDQLIIVIPADHRSDLNYEAHHQHQFCERVVATMSAVLWQNEPSSPPLSDLAKKLENARQHLIDHHGIEQNRKTYIELRYSIKKYPYQDDYLHNFFQPKDVSWHIKQNGAISLRDCLDGYFLAFLVQSAISEVIG